MVSLFVLSGSSGHGRQASRAPLRQTIFQSPGLETTSSKRRNRLVRQHAIGTATVGNNLLRGIKLGEARFKLAERDVHRAREVSQSEFIRRPDIDDGHRARARQFQEFLARDWL